MPGDRRAVCSGPAGRPRLRLVSSSSPSGSAPRGGHRAQADTIAGRRLSIVVLAVGAVLALSTLLGQLWVTRAGVVLAVTAGALALGLAWRAAARHLRVVRAQHADHIREQLGRHRSDLSDQRARHTSVVEVLEGRNALQRQSIVVLEHRVKVLRGQLTGLRSQVGRLQPEVSMLRGDKAALQLRISDLEAELVRREHELAEVVDLPRRGTVADPLSTPSQIWADDDHPTVADLRAIEPAPADEVRRQA